MTSSFQQGAVLTTGAAFGNRPENVEVPFYGTRAPTTTDTGGNFPFPIGKMWDWPGNGTWRLNELTSAGGVLSALWLQLASSSGDVLSVTGTSTGIIASPTTGAVNLTVSSTFTSPGSLRATSGAITASNGNLVFGTAGNKITAPAATTTTAGANSFGTVALVGGTATVATTSVTAASIILITTQVLGTVSTPQAIAVTGRTPGTSFTITSAGGTDTSTIGWEIIN